MCFYSRSSFLISVAKLCTSTSEDSAPYRIKYAIDGFHLLSHLIILLNVFIFEGIRKRVNFKVFPST